MSEHTPGPWGVHDLGIYADGICVAVCDAGIAIEQEMANARLIAAAPDLLEAIERLLFWESESFSDPAVFAERFGTLVPEHPESSIGMDHWLDIWIRRPARDAIAKARGQS